MRFASGRFFSRPGNFPTSTHARSRIASALRDLIACPEAQALHVSLNIDYLTYARRHMRVATNGKREVP